MYKNGIDLRIVGGKPLTGDITTTCSKNGGVALLCAALINKGKTTLHGIPRNMEEIARIVEVIEHIGVSITWRDDTTIEIVNTGSYHKDGLVSQAASMTRACLMLIPAMTKTFSDFSISYPGGCKMGNRTIKGHTRGLADLGIAVEQKEEVLYVKKKGEPRDRVVVRERGDTATINILLAAALLPKQTVIAFASSNYQVQEVCFFLEMLGVRIEGVGTSTLTVHGKAHIEEEVVYENSEDPIEAMFFITAAIMTAGTLSLRRIPIDFLELELLTLQDMGLQYNMSERYVSHNGKTNLVDITIHPSKLVALKDKIHAVPYPGINTDNLPYFACIATQAEGVTLIHDWMWEIRSIYMTELNRLGARVTLYDPHRFVVQGKTPLRAAQIVAPPALRPAAVMLAAMLSAPGESLLRDTYVVHRGHSNLVPRLQSLGADISTVTQ